MLLQVDEATSTVVLDTNAGQWVSPAIANGEDYTRRCRHAVASVGPFVFIYGGLKGSQLLDDLLVADDSNGAELSIFDPRAQPWTQWLDATHGNAAAAQLLAKAAMEEAAAALSVRRVSAVDDLKCIDEQIDSIERGSRLSDSPSSQRSESPDVTLGKAYNPSTSQLTPDVRLWHRAVVVHQENSLRGLVRQLSIDQLDNEGRRVSIYEKGQGEKSPLFTRSMSTPVGPRGDL